MPGEGLKIVVGADVKQAEQALKGLTSTASTEGQKAGNALGAGLSQALPALEKIPLASSQAASSVSKLGASLAALLERKANIQLQILDETDIDKIGILNTNLEAVNAEITRVSRAGKQGFDDLGNAINGPVGAIPKLQARLAELQAGLGQVSEPKNIARINAEIEKVTLNITKLTRAGKEGFDQFGDEINKANGPLLQIETLQAKISQKKSLLHTETDVKKVIQLNQEIESLESVLKQVQNTGKFGFFGGKKLPDESLTINRTKTALDKLSPSVRGANSTLVSLSRIAQDAPFGFIAIQNNITELIPTFQRLKAETGSTGAALRSVGASLLGAGGFGFGISVITSLLTVFALNSRGAKKETEQLKKATEEADEVAKKYSQSLDKAASSVVSEADKLRDLRALLITVDNATIKLTESTIKQGLARFIFDEKNTAAQKLLSAALRQQLALFTKVREFDETEFKIEGVDKTIKTFKELGVTVPKALKETRQGLVEQAEAEDDIKSLNSIGQGMESLFKLFLDGKKTAKDATDDVISEAKRIAAFLDKNTQFSVTFDVDPSVDEAAQKQSARNFIARARRFIEEQNSKGTIFTFKPTVLTDFSFKFNKKVIENIRDQAGIEGTRTYKEVKKAFEDNIEQMAKNIPIVGEVTADVNLNIRKFNKNQQNLASALGVKLDDNEALGALTQIQKEAVAAASAINGVLTPSFQNLFSAIAKGENPMKALFDSIGQAVLQLMQKIIAAAIQAAILSAIFPTGVGGVKGFGGFFKNAFGFAAGGLVSGPTLGLIGEGLGTSKNNPEVIAPLDKLKGMLAGMTTNNNTQPVIVMGRIRGNQISLLSNRQQRRGRRLGA